jgi:hypothetical protein
MVHPVLLVGGKFPPADATTRGANEAVQIYTARLSVSSEPTIRSTTFSKHTVHLTEEET